MVQLSKLVGVGHGHDLQIGIAKEQLVDVQFVRLDAIEPFLYSFTLHVPGDLWVVVVVVCNTGALSDHRDVQIEAENI
jgi:hypothetical protein